MAKAEKTTEKRKQEREQEREGVEYGDMVFGYLEDGEISPCFSLMKKDELGHAVFEVEEDEEENAEEDEEKKKKFWKNQQEVLEATLCRSSALETRIRQATKATLKEIRMSETVCVCGKPMASSCRGCLMTQVSSRLRSAGFESAVCRSKWRSSSDIPSGEHKFIEVLDKSSSKRGEIRVIVELNFRAEFEMARASEDYSKLARRLPEIFVGKSERLSNVIKILCSAAKKCMKEKKMHLGPWRKHKYMQAKWLGTCERISHVPAELFPATAENGGENGGMRRPRTSMLTVGLMEKLPAMVLHAAVQVV